jgi:hypothetical protein
MGISQGHQDFATGAAGGRVLVRVQAQFRRARARGTFCVTYPPIQEEGAVVGGEAERRGQAGAVPGGRVEVAGPDVQPIRIRAVHADGRHGRGREHALQEQREKSRGPDRSAGLNTGYRR